MNEAHEKAHAILTEHRDRIETMAKVLLAKESVEGDELMALMNGTWTEDEFGPLPNPVSDETEKGELTDDKEVNADTEVSLTDTLSEGDEE